MEYFNSLTRELIRTSDTEGKRDGSDDSDFEYAKFLFVLFITISCKNIILC